MKIAESAMQLQSDYSYRQQIQSSESLRVWVDRPAASSSTAMQASFQVDISLEARQRLSGETSAVKDGDSDQNVPPDMQLIKSLVELLTGQKIRVFDPSKLGSPDAAQAPAPDAGPGTGFGLAYDAQQSYSESQSLSIEAKGVIKTADGQEIKFNLKLEMSYQYSETSQTSIRIGEAARKTDPLVLNFNGTAAQLSDQTFAFDLNGDGKAENISLLQPGSGFLALDKNGDGKIDSGNELFGPASGDGFRELAAHDSDHNGWIDESDPVFGKLQVWQKDAGGKDQLNSLSALGVGALSLHAVATPFDLKTADNKMLGSLHNSGVYLNEDGSAGSLQQLDLVA